MEKKLIRWKANGGKPTKNGLKGQLSFCAYVLTQREKEQLLEELKENFGNSFQVEDKGNGAIEGFVEGYYWEVTDKMFELGWEW
jgi:hypothetical protein